MLSQGWKSKLNRSSFCDPDWWYFGKKKKQQNPQRKKTFKEFVVGQELCLAVPCTVAWAGGSGAAVFIYGDDWSKSGCALPRATQVLKNQACAGLYLSAGRSHRGEINPSDGINYAMGRADGWAQHMVVAPVDSALGQKKPPVWVWVCPAAFCCVLVPSPTSWVGCRQLLAPES